MNATRLDKGHALSRTVCCHPTALCCRQQNGSCPCSRRQIKQGGGEGRGVGGGRGVVGDGGWGELAEEGGAVPARATDSRSEREAVMTHRTRGQALVSVTAGIFGQPLPRLTDGSARNHRSVCRLCRLVHWAGSLSNNVYEYTDTLGVGVHLRGHQHSDTLQRCRSPDWSVWCVCVMGCV